MRITVAQQAPVASATITRARASVSIVVPVLEPSAVLLASSTTSVVAQAVTAVETLVSANSYILLNSSSVLDTSGLYSYKTDISVVTDASFRIVGKTLTDTFGSDDYITDKTFDLGKNDSVSLTESMTRTLEFIRRFTELVNLPENVSFLLQKQSADSFSFEDSSTRSFSKQRTDSFSVPDAAPVFAVNKARTDSFTLADTMARGYAKPLADAATPTDTKSFSFSRPVVDSFSFTDSTSLIPTKGLVDSFTHADAANRDFAKARTDSFSLADASTQTTDKALADTFSQTDANTRAVDKVLADAFAFSELLTRSLTRTIQDGFAMNDTADLADGITYQTVKYVNNLAFVSDAKVLTSSLGKTETVTLVSAGVLSSQSYCDMSYFATDYVGVSRTFS